MRPAYRGSFLLMVLTLLGALPAVTRAEEEGWIDLTASNSLEAFKAPTGAWEYVGGIGLDPENPKRFRVEPGTGILYNGPRGRTTNLVTKENFGDVEVSLEFMVPKGSNAGVKLEGVYEIQIYDSYGVTKLKGSDCGGIYPRAELLPRYHHIDEGYPPRVNACKPPGTWQTLDIVFRAPRFDADGKKTANARFVKVVLNGQIVQEDVELPSPTGNNWKKKETPTGPILFQADHGPIAFRNIRVRPLKD
ncbi:MAG: DUF1080 domain-containing protein [Isosphaeraceae bacterium]|nr:DUF1080 domain-containing protein [Isosphaeraceae bacterium]